MRDYDTEVTKWLYNIQQEKLGQAFDNEDQRYGYMTTNFVECANLVLKSIRNLPIIALVKLIYFWLAELFVRTCVHTQAQITLSQLFSEALIKIIQENQQVTRIIYVCQFKATIVYTP